MTSEFHPLENSLKDFLTEANSKGYSSGQGAFYKYNNLKIFMNPKQNATPHFIIRIGLSEAMFNLQNGDKILGSLGPDERIVKNWINRNFFNFNLDDAWKQEKKVKPVIMDEKDNDL